MALFPAEGVMQKLSLVVPLLAATVCTGVLAADMLPLKKGIFVPVGRPCKGASNAEMVNYWGDKASLESSQATCTITRLQREGKVFTITDKCSEIRSGAEFAGGPTAVTITSPTSFTRSGEAYRYCGHKVQF
jgi:hypothetical protein